VRSAVRGGEGVWHASSGEVALIVNRPGAGEGAFAARAPALSGCPPALSAPRCSAGAAAPSHQILRRGRQWSCSSDGSTTPWWRSRTFGAVRPAWCSSRTRGGASSSTVASGCRGRCRWDWPAPHGGSRSPMRCCAWVQFADGRRATHLDRSPPLPHRGARPAGADREGIYSEAAAAYEGVRSCIWTAPRPCTTGAANLRPCLAGTRDLRIRLRSTPERSGDGPPPL
jgi:hypothetical protein